MQIRLDQSLKRIRVSAFEVESEIGFALFDRTDEAQREELFLRALHIGFLALEDERLSTFLAKTQNELGTELESLKIRFDAHAKAYAKSSVKGVAAEEAIIAYLEEFCKANGIADSIAATGTSAGTILKNKTGDILCSIDGTDDRRIVIECKFDKGVTEGELDKRDWHGKNLDTAWSQLIEAKANRAAQEAIIVFDQSSVNSALQKSVQQVSYIPKIGFIVIVDSLRGDFNNLGVAYRIARQLACADPTIHIENDFVVLIIQRILKDLKDVNSVKDLVIKNITNCREILERIEKGMLAIELSHKFLGRVLEERSLTSEALLEFYSGSDIKNRYLSIESDILAMCK